MIEDLPNLAAIGLGLLAALGGVLMGLLRSQTVPREPATPPDSRSIDLAVDEINRSAAREMDEIDQSNTPGSAAREARRRRRRNREQ